jgi:hypothetical protein
MQSCCASAVAACTETAVCVPKHLAGRANWPATQKSVDVDGKPPTRQGTGVCQPRVNPRSIRSRIGQQGGLPRASDRTPVPTRRVRAPACGFDEPLRRLPHRDAAVNDDRWLRRRRGGSMSSPTRILRTTSGARMASIRCASPFGGITRSRARTSGAARRAASAIFQAVSPPSLCSHRRRAWLVQWLVSRAH